jgi:hypothetical protein
MSSLSFTSIFLTALVIYFVIKLIRRRPKARVVRKDRGEVERWVDDALARELHRRLGLDRELLLRALEGTPEPEAVGAMEEAVRAMQVKYTWSPDGLVEVRLEITFEDSTSASTSRMFPRDAMPAGVRNELTRTGAAYVYRAVYFPWSRPE